MKKLQVNAQVTYFTSLLELFGNATIVVHVVYTKSATFSTLIHNMIFYCILSPHVFLTNTSDNKYRIVEYGWKNVIRNLFRRETISAPDKRVQTSMNDSRYESNKCTKSNSVADSQMSNSSTKMIKKSNYDRADTPSSNSLAVKRSPNKTIKNSNQQRRNNSSKKTIYREFSVFPKRPADMLLNVTDLEKQRRQQAILENLIRRLDHNIDREQEYLLLLRKLSVFLEFCDKNKVLSYFEIEKEIENKSRQRLNVNELSEDLPHRIRMRKKELDKLKKLDDRTTSYLSNIRKLIKLEETFSMMI